MGHRAGLPSLACRHVVEDVLHGAAVGQGALSQLGSVQVAVLGLLLLLPVSSLTLVGVQEKNQLLLDQFSLLGVGGMRRSSPHAAGLRDALVGRTGHATGSGLLAGLHGGTHGATRGTGLLQLCRVPRGRNTVSKG